MNPIWKKLLPLSLCLALTVVTSGCQGGEKPGVSDGSGVSSGAIYATEPGASAESSEGSGAVVTDPSGNVVDPGSHPETPRPGGTTKTKAKTEQAGTSSTQSYRPPVASDTPVTPSGWPDLGGREIRLGQWWAPANYAPDQQAQKYTNSKFKEVQLTDYATLYTSILAGQPIVDIFAVYDMPLLQLIKSDYVLPLEQYLDFSLPKWNQVSVKESTVGTHTYSMNNGNVVEGPLLYYNKTMLEQYGFEDLYELQKAGKLTWEYLDSIITTIPAKNSSYYGIVPVYDYANFTKHLLEANGALFVNREAKTLNLSYGLQSNQNAAINAMNYAQKWMKDPNSRYVYDNTQFGWDTNRTFFASGKAALCLVAYGQGAEIAINARFDLGMCLFPGGPDAQHDLVSQSEYTYVCIPKGVENPEQVAAYWDCRTSVFMETEWSEEKNLQDMRDMMDSKSGYESLKRYYDMIRAGQYTYDYLSTVMGDVSAFDLGKVARGETTPAAFINSVAPQIKAAISDFSK